MADPAPSFNEIVELCQTEAQTVAPSLSFNDGDVSQAMSHAGAAMFDFVVGWFAGEIRRLFFGGARGDDLDEIIQDRLKLPRNAAKAAYGIVTFYRNTAGSAGTIPKGTQIATWFDTSGERKIYTLDDDVPYGSGSFSVTGNATAVNAGRDSTTVGNFNLAILSDLGDANIGAYSEGFAGGNDKETDEQYLVRAVNNWVSQRRGTLQALETGAVDNTGATIAKANEDDASGVVSIYVSDSTGGSTRAMEYQVMKSLEEYRSAGTAIRVVGGGKSTLRLSISIDSYEAGFDVAAAATIIKDSIKNRVNSLRVSQDLTLKELNLAIMAPFAGQIHDFSYLQINLDGVDRDLTQNIPANGRLITLDGDPEIKDGAAQ